MPLAFKLTAVAVTGTLQQVFDQPMRGLAGLRLLVRNAGAAALTAAQVQVRGETAGPPAVVDSTTFATLASGATASLVVPGPAEALRMLASSAGTTLDVWVTSEPG
jgi:hypothetical protein